MKSVAARASGFAVEEMVETATSMGAQAGRQKIITSLTDDIQSDFVKEVVQDGLSSGYSVLTQGVMMAEQALLEKVFNGSASLATAIVLKGKTRWSKMVGKRGRKASMLSKVLGRFDSLGVDHARLVADFGNMNTSGRTAVSTNNVASSGLSMTQSHRMSDLKSEEVKVSMAQTTIESMRNTFEMKLKTSSFTSDDERLIKQVTGIHSITSEHIAKLNAFSSSQVFKDSSGNYVGGSQVMAELMTGMSLRGSY